jgi:CRISPR-associated protein Csa1
MYFLSEVERKYIVHKLLPLAREVGVSGELRGWNWHQAPLKPYYDDVRLPMYAVSSKYCPSGRDVYLSFIEGVKPVLNFKVALGKILHGVVSDCLLAFMEGSPLEFKDWCKRVRWGEVPSRPEDVLPVAEKVWSYLAKMCEARYAEVEARQPYASRRDLIASTVPFLVEHRISGELLGLSGILSLDCYDYLRSIMFDLKVGATQQDWHRLAPVGYALVFESLHEVPVDVCCVVYLDYINDRIVVKKDLFFASDELRNWWIEERDAKLEIVAEGKDPGKPEEKSCPNDCIYRHACFS